MTRIERIRASGVGYIAKYPSKQFHGDNAGEDGLPFPRGARLSGGGGLEAVSRAESRMADCLLSGLNFVIMFWKVIDRLRLSLF